ncbi:response regulator [Pedobacter duraquae]|uniref:histidine kinase n=1 Tax=Pedobacter duraquae TaxID=425511 RepID=A0A4R6IMC8_9SPHI|nr:response regulator [Pedobacter duraquae]TDO23287.1 signal transduction histidine kinase [Pedobacter duraquae]
MTNNRFKYLIVAAFILGTFFLGFLRYTSAQNMQVLLEGNAELLKELRLSNHLRTIDRDMLGVESRIRAAIATDDTSHLNGVDEKIQELESYIDTLKATDRDARTTKYLDRLQVIANQKIEIKKKLMDLYLKTGRVDDTTYIANPGARKISDEITFTTKKIYDSRQQLMTELSLKIDKSGRTARFYGNWLSVILLFVSGGLCWFIIRQFDHKNQLISQLDHSEKKAREALQVKENFLANMSHEIRTPLNSILGFTNLLKRKKLEAEPAEFVASIQGAGENLLAIINDILDLSKIEAGMMRIVANPFSVRGLVHSIETLFGEKVKEKGLILHSQIDSDVPDTLVGDATRLTQILVNLIGNALKFSERGQIAILVSGKKSSENTFELGFRIKDQGIGIDQAKLEGIFERFNQAEDSITRNYGGTGLGLSIVKNLVVLQDGKITVESAKTTGTEFHFVIPYEIAKEQLDVVPVFDASLLTNHMDQTLRILVVDDNVMNQSLMKHLLTEWNAAFDIVSSGTAALAQLKQQKYDLVLMDIQMPGMDGYTATQHIRENLGLKIPVIAMTAHAMAGEREKCLSFGMNEYISKPINEDDLFKLICKFIQLDCQPNAVSPVDISMYKVIDLSYMKAISKGNTAYEKTVTQQFITLIPQDLEALRAKYEEGDIFGINQIAHNLKTTVAIMGLLPQLEDQLDQLEYVKSDALEIPDLIDNVAAICTAALGEAREFQDTLNNG